MEFTGIKEVKDLSCTTKQSEQQQQRQLQKKTKAKSLLLLVLPFMERKQAGKYLSGQGELLF